MSTENDSYIVFFKNISLSKGSPVNEQTVTFMCPYLNEDSLVRTDFSKVTAD